LYEVVQEDVKSCMNCKTRALFIDKNLPQVNSWIEQYIKIQHTSILESGIKGKTSMMEPESFFVHCEQFIWWEENSGGRTRLQRPQVAQEAATKKKLHQRSFQDT